MDSNIATVTITVNAVNDQPTANAQSVTVVEDSDDNAITLTGSTGPANESGQTLTFQLMSLPSNGTLSQSAGGPALGGPTFPIVLADAEIFFTPNANYCSGDNDFQFRVVDSGERGAAASTRRPTPRWTSPSPASTTRPSWRS